MQLCKQLKREGSFKASLFDRLSIWLGNGDRVGFFAMRVRESYKKPSHVFAGTVPLFAMQFM